MNITINDPKPINRPKLSAELLGVAGALETIPGALIIMDVTDTSRARAIYDAHDPSPTPAEIAAGLRRNNAKSVAQSANGWFTWDITTALGWVDTNIGLPLSSGRANLPASITLTNIRPILIAFLDILDKILVALIALTKVVVALRDDKWPEQ